MYGTDAHHIDHLAPLAELLKIPLLFTEEELAARARQSYPFIETLFYHNGEVAEKTVSNYDVLLCSLPRLLFDEVFFFAQHFLQKRVATVWCPHGNSDKGHHSYFMKALIDEELALVYGKKMVDFLQEKGVYGQLKKAIVMGDVRFSLYKKHRDHYQALLKEKILKHLPKTERLWLYAPTWKDGENNTSFFDAASHLIAALPKNAALIVKLHPNLAIQEEFAIEALRHKHRGNKRLLFVHDFDPIYPLLDAVDLYIGDMSSIGYDFLFFDKPLFFLNAAGRCPQTDPALYLARTGTVIEKGDFPRIPSIIERALCDDKELFSGLRKEVKEYTFTHIEDLDALKQEIFQSFDL